MFKFTLDYASNRLHHTILWLLHNLIFGYEVLILDSSHGFPLRRGSCEMPLALVAFLVLLLYFSLGSLWTCAPCLHIRSILYHYVCSPWNSDPSSHTCNKSLLRCTSHNASSCIYHTISLHLHLLLQALIICFPRWTLKILQTSASLMPYLFLDPFLLSGPLRS